MPDLATWHPQIVHFVIGLLVVGVVLRLISLTNKAQFTGPAATTLLLIGTVAAVLAVKSGTDAHGPAERVPGARDAVVEHEEWGERTRNMFLIVAGVEILALAFRRKPARHRAVLAASAVLGLGGLYILYETGEHGGELVYNYAGGVGIRSGDPQDVGRLLLAGLYHQGQLDRKEERPLDAAAAFEEMGRRFPNDPSIQLFAVESLLLDRKNPERALKVLQRVSVPSDDQRLALRFGLLSGDALAQAGLTDSARTTLQRLETAFPTNQRVKALLAKLGPGQ